MSPTTTLAFRAAAYDASGRAVATSRITWDCTSGAILRVEHRGNAAAPIPARLVEYRHAVLDHYFLTADTAEIAMLDGGSLAGWQRTGQGIDVAAVRDGRVFTSPVPASDFGAPKWMLGLRYLANTLHPDRFAFDIEADADAYHKQFFGEAYPLATINRSFAKPSRLWRFDAARA